MTPNDGASRGRPRPLPRERHDRQRTSTDEQEEGERTSANIFRPDSTGAAAAAAPYDVPMSPAKSSQADSLASAALQMGAAVPADADPSNGQLVDMLRLIMSDPRRRSRLDHHEDRVNPQGGSIAKHMTHMETCFNDKLHAYACDARAHMDAQITHAARCPCRRLWTRWRRIRRRPKATTRRRAPGLLLPCKLASCVWFPTESVATRTSTSRTGSTRSTRRSSRRRKKDCAIDAG